MAFEIERRFLVKGENWRDLSQNEAYLKQAYLSSDKKGWAIRVRIIEEKHSWICLKKKGQGIINHEFEYKIPIKDAQELWGLSQQRIEKVRHNLNINNRDWIVDCFIGENHPLVIAEVELQSEIEPINIPLWCSKEITGQYKWSNAALAARQKPNGANHNSN